MSTITKGVKALVQDAKAEIDSISVEDAKALHGDDGVQFVDIRDVRELDREGRIPGARHAPRGMLEFWVDPDSPYHKTWFAEDKRFVLFCASSWRSALATKALRDMGMTNVCELEGGFTAWRDAGGAIEKAD